MSYTIEQLDCAVRTATDRLRKDLASAEEQLRDQTARWGAVVDERDRLRASLRAVLKLHSFKYLDKGIGTATPEGMTLMRARRLAEAE